MDSKTSIYKLNEVELIDIKEFYYQELMLLANQTGMGKDAYVPYEPEEVEDYIDQYGIIPLRDDIAEKLSIFMYNVCGTELTVSKIKDDYAKNSKGYTALIILRRVIPEWWEYFYPSQTSSCNIYFIESLINEQKLGGVFVFANSKYDYIIVQGIAKYIAPTLAYVLYPECQVHKLNKLLEPSIEALAKTHNATKIYIKPLLNQMDILLKYYGYKLEQEIWELNKRQFYFCDTILRATGYWIYKNVNLKLE